MRSDAVSPLSEEAKEIERLQFALNRLLYLPPNEAAAALSLTRRLLDEVDDERIVNQGHLERVRELEERIALLEHEKEDAYRHASELVDELHEDHGPACASHISGLTRRIASLERELTALRGESK